MITFLRDDIFDSPAQTLVNAVNTVGVMGKGIAREYKTRFPEMFKKYKSLCDQNKLSPGLLHLWRGEERWVLNFPTKTTWRRPSELTFIEAGLKKFIDHYERLGVQSISFPPLGCGNGNLDWADVKPLMVHYLSQADIPVFIHDSHVSKNFVPEHVDTHGRAIPQSAVDFIADIEATVSARSGIFTTLKKNTPFQAHTSPDHFIRIENMAGATHSKLHYDELKEIWALLQNGLVTTKHSDSTTTQRRKSYLFPILAQLPYIRTAEVAQTYEQGHSYTGMAIYLKRDTESLFDDATGEPQQCLSL